MSFCDKKSRLLLFGGYTEIEVLKMAKFTVASGMKVFSIW